MYLSARGPSENDDTPLFRFMLIGEDNGGSDNEILFTIRAHLSGQNGCSKFILLQEICPFWCESFLVQNQYSCNLCFSIQITVGHHFRLIDDIGKSRCLRCQNEYYFGIWRYIGHVMNKKVLIVLEIGDRSGIEGHNLNYESSLLFRNSTDMGVNDLPA